MSETPSKKETAQKPTEKKKNFLGKLKESVDEREEQLLAILSTLVRLGILVWSGGILTLAYIATPPAWGIPEQKLDPTFIASVFTGVLATFGVQAAKGKSGGNGNGITAAELKTLIEAAAQVAPSQTIRLEHAPLTIAPTNYPDPPKKDAETN